ncbi:MAG: glycosyltransferase family 9 protein [Alphaproteobacteria bacterium]|nr:glycosyltransferase family 9 protein [Alphaproteobacteria bacterium]
MFPTPPPTRKTGKTLILQPLPGIGDMVWHLPHVDAIAAATRTGTVTLMTKARALGDQLFAGDTRIDDILPLFRGLEGKRHDGVMGARRLGQDLADRGFEVVWIFHGSARYGMAAALARIPERIGFGIGWQNMFLTTQHPLIRKDERLHPSEKATKLLEQNGLTVDPIPHYTPPEAARVAIERDFGDLPRPWFSLGIGSSETFKQWGAERFAELSDAMTAEVGGTVFLLAGPDEREMAAQIASGRGAVKSVVARPLSEAAALAQACDVMISNDTGLMNLAAATGATTVGLFGGSPAIDHFYPSLSAVTPPGGAVYKDDRMTEITVAMVLQEIRARTS